jgi:hypothetical protein
MNGEPNREVICADAIPWLRERGRIDGACAVTSLPDVSEVGVTLEVWRAWFLGAVRLVVNAVPDESAALFFQSDIKRDGEWIDKGAMVIGAAQDAGARVLFHKIVLRRPAGMLTTGRPGFTHFIAVSRALKCPDGLAIPDVIADAGEQKWVGALCAGGCGGEGGGRSVLRRRHRAGGRKCAGSRRARRGEKPEASGGGAGVGGKGGRDLGERNRADGRGKIFPVKHAN